MKTTAKRLLPRWAHHLVNRLVSRGKIRRRHGDWFDLEWKRRAGGSSDRDWVETYDRSWEHWEEQDLAPKDLERIRERGERCDTLLDAGCGDGYLLAALAGAARRRFGADLSGEGLVRARERLGPNVPLVQAFLEALPFADRAFEVVVSTHVLEHVRDLDAAISELKRVCRRRLIVLVPRQQYLPYTEDYHLHFFPEARDLRAAFADPRARVERFTIPEGVCAYAGDIHLLTLDL